MIFKGRILTKHKPMSEQFEQAKAIVNAYNKGLLTGAEMERLKKDMSWQKIAERLYHCTKCGDEVRGDEDSLCGRCVTGL